MRIFTGLFLHQFINMQFFFINIPWKSIVSGFQHRIKNSNVFQYIKKLNGPRKYSFSRAIHCGARLRLPGSGFLPSLFTDKKTNISYIYTGIKVIRKFFIKHNKSFRWHLGDYEKACRRRNFDFCVFYWVSSLPIKNRFI